MLTGLGKELHENGLLLSSALGPWGVMLTDEAKESLDLVNIMAYDWAKIHATITVNFIPAIISALNTLSKKDSEKISFFLAYRFTATPETKANSCRQAILTLKSIQDLKT